MNLMADGSGAATGLWSFFYAPRAPATTLFTLLRQTGNTMNTFTVPIALFSENSDTRRQNTNIYIANYTWKVRRNVFFMCLVDKVESGISNKYRRGGGRKKRNGKEIQFVDAARCCEKGLRFNYALEGGFNELSDSMRANRFVGDDRRLSGICRWQPWDSCFQSQGEDWF